MGTRLTPVDILQARPSIAPVQSGVDGRKDMLEAYVMLRHRLRSYGQASSEALAILGGT